MTIRASDTLVEILRAFHRNADKPEAVIVGLEVQAGKREQRIGKLQTEAVALRGIANHLRSLFEETGSTEKSSGKTLAPASPPESSGIRPEGMEAIRQIMKHGSIWTSNQLLDEMKRRGWESKE